MMESCFPILIADDNSDDAFLLERALKRAKKDCKIAHVESFEQSIQYLNGVGEFADRSRYPFPKLIISDASMPSEFGGFDILHWQRTHPEAQQVPVIICSGNLNPDFIRKAYQLGAHSYFAKPGVNEDMEQFFDAFFRYWNLVTKPGTGRQTARSGG